MDDLNVRIESHVAVVEIRRPPHNYFDFQLIEGLADCFEELDQQSDVRAIVLASQGDSFCAGADLSRGVRSVAERRPGRFLGA